MKNTHTALISYLATPVILAASILFGGCAINNRDYTKINTTYKTSSGKYSISEKSVTIGDKTIYFTVLGIGDKNFVLNKKGDKIRLFKEGDLVESVNSACNGVEDWFQNPKSKQKIKLQSAKESGSINTSK